MADANLAMPQSSNIEIEFLSSDANSDDEALSSPWRSNTARSTSDELKGLPNTRPDFRLASHALSPAPASGVNALQRIVATTLTPTAFFDAKLYQVDEWLLFLGGWSPPVSGKASVAMLWLFEINTTRWLQLNTTGIQPAPRARQTSVLLEANATTAVFLLRGGIILVDEEYTPPWVPTAADTVSDEMFTLTVNISALPPNPSTDSQAAVWARVEPLAFGQGDKPSARVYESMGLLGRCVVVYGGLNVTVLNDTWAFDTLTGQWHSLDGPGQLSPGPRCLHVSSVLASRFVVAGGCPTVGDANPLCTDGNTLHDAWELTVSPDCTAGTWTSLTVQGTFPSVLGSATTNVPAPNQALVYSGIAAGGAGSSGVWNVTRLAGDVLSVSALDPYPHSPLPLGRCVLWMERRGGGDVGR